MSVLTDQELWDITNRWFGDLGTGVVQGMFQIAKRESGGDTGAYNYNPATRDDSHGLWQINVRPDANPRYASWDLSNPELNAQAARELYNAAGPSPWSTYQPAYDAALFNARELLPYDIASAAPPAQPAPPMLAYNAAALADGASRQMYTGGVQGPHAESAAVAPAEAKPAPMLPPDDILLPLLRDSLSIWGGRLPAPLDAMYAL